MTVHFQGAQAIAEGSKEADLSTATAWVTDISQVNSRQFVRYRIIFDLLERTNQDLSPTTPRPAVQSLRLRAEF